MAASAKSYYNEKLMECGGIELFI